MEHHYRHIKVDRRGDVFCVRLTRHMLDEMAIHEMFNELRSLVTEEGCRRLALSLGPDRVECLYSVFLAKLITLQRVLRENGGELALCHVQPPVHEIFEACSLDKLFSFRSDFDDAGAQWAK
jgi:anti-anti-sigma factor